MKQPGRQASGQDGSRSPACHSGNKHFRGRSAGSVSFVTFPLHRCSKRTGHQCRGQGSGRWTLMYGMASPERARMWTGKYIKGTVMVLTILLFADRRKRVFSFSASATSRYLCKKSRHLVTIGLVKQTRGGGVLCPISSILREYFFEIL
jgi:hypothetical protein